MENVNWIDNDAAATIIAVKKAAASQIKPINPAAKFDFLPLLGNYDQLHLRVSLDFLFALQMAKIHPNLVAKILM